MMIRSGVLALAGGALLATGLAAQAEQLRVRVGLELTYAAVNQGEPDYESILAFVRGDSTEFTIRWSWNRGPERRWKHYERLLSATERRTARSFYMYGSDLDPRQFRGTTPAMLSAALLRGLKTTGQVEAVVLQPGLTSMPFRGRLTRIGSVTEPFPLYLDGLRIELPAIRVEGTFTGDRPLTEQYLVLDDPAAPWLLSVRTAAAGRTAGFEARLARVESGARTGGLAEELRAACRATLRNLYFATGSAEIDTTSAPTIAGIRTMLAANPAWRIEIIGHTDSIGTAPANLDLSRRRAERVRAMVTAAGGAESARVTAVGKGETEPVADNGTVEGRAANRRVDLVRPCTRPL